jgi:hypothetical protein
MLHSPRDFLDDTALALRGYGLFIISFKKFSSSGVQEIYKEVMKKSTEMFNV